MSLAWETTPEDVDIVINAHGVKKTIQEVEKIHELYIAPRATSIERAILHYNDFDDQMDESLRFIEELLSCNDIIIGSVLFEGPGRKR